MLPASRPVSIQPKPSAGSTSRMEVLENGKVTIGTHNREAPNTSGPGAAAADAAATAATAVETAATGASPVTGTQSSNTLSIKSSSKKNNAATLAGSRAHSMTSSPGTAGLLWPRVSVVSAASVRVLENGEVVLVSRDNEAPNPCSASPAHGEAEAEGRSLSLTSFQSTTAAPTNNDARESDAESRIRSAIAEYSSSEKSSIRTIAAKYNIPYPTLYRRWRSGNTVSAKEKKLTEGQEKELSDWIQERIKKGNPPCHADIHKKAVRILKKANAYQEKLGNKWVERFVQRHSYLNLTRYGHYSRRAKPKPPTRKYVKSDHQRWTQGGARVPVLDISNNNHAESPQDDVSAEASTEHLLPREPGSAQPESPRVLLSQRGVESLRERLQQRRQERQERQERRAV
ncbi:uncharacterized protein LODBEIA_P18600 [Lodderomyces beijingensis]|uniref:HTH CENPB-type domain-containing protein n=1 Tax=Lodderomyces beijingensis TaxID=1775926 RepID=A0ABP0ZL72_9ASCO